MTSRSVLQLTKHHGLGNDFLIVLDDDGSVEVDAIGALARRWCHRRRGIGADGLIVARRDRDSIRMHLRNADGSRAELSGNGLRCLAQALGRADWISGAAIIETDAGPRRAELHGDAAEASVSVSIEMGHAVVSPAPPAAGPILPEAKELAFVDVGNPHIVAVVADLAHHDPAVVGPLVETAVGHAINVHLVRVVDTGTVDMRIWERGAGVTEACGTGATAAVAALNGLGLVGRRVRVRMPGGEAEVTVADPLVLTGEATFVAAIEVER